MATTYAVEIEVGGERLISRIFTTLAAARKWARFTAAKWPTRILAGGAGGCEVR